MEERIDWTAVARYLLNDFSPEEKQEFEQQLEQDPAFHQAFKEISFLWKSSAKLGQRIKPSLSEEELADQIVKIKELISQEENSWTQLARQLQKDEEGVTDFELTDLPQSQKLWEASHSLGQKYHASQPVDMPASLAKMKAKIAELDQENSEPIGGMATAEVEKPKPSPLKIADETDNVVQLSRRNFFMRIAAAVALVISATAVGYYFSTGYEEAVTYATLHTESNEVKNITLADGTIVWVNENSTLKYPEAFNGNDRHVLLEGEAYFDVAKDASKPFSIITEASETTVLGTAFNLNARPGKEVVLAVVEGKVKFAPKENPEAGKVLTVNQIGTLNGVELNVVDGDALAFSKWKQATLEFHDKKFAEVIKVLEKTYKVSIKLEAKDLADRKFSGKFEKQTIIEVLDIMGEILGFTYEQEDTSFVIKK